MAKEFLAAAFARLSVFQNDKAYRCPRRLTNRLLRFLLPFIISLGIQNLNAATIQSNGTGGGNWNTGASWNGGIVPLTTDDVIILAGDVINATTNQSCVNIQISGTLNFNTNSVTISPSGNLTFSGTGSTTNGSASRSLNVTGNLLSLTGADGTVSGINMMISGNTNLLGRIVFASSGGSKTLTGDVTINNGGAIDFSAGGISIILINNLIMSGTSSLGGTSGSTGTLIGVNSFTLNAGANATIGRVTMAIVGTTIINGTVTFSNTNGTKTFVGACTLNNNGSIEFTAAAAVNLNNSLTINGTTSIGGSSSATGNLTIGNDLILSTGTNLNLGRATLTVSGLTSLDGILNLTNTLGNKTLSNDFSVGSNGSINFSVAETLDIGSNLISNPGSTLGGGAATGIINVGGNYNAATGGTSIINNLTLTISANVSIPGTAIVNTSGGTSTISVGGNWNITSSDSNPFIEGTSRVIFNGTAGTQTINTTEAGGETFYNLTINNTSAASPGLSASVNLNARSITYSNGILDLAGKNLNITGDGSNTTDSYSSGSIITSIAGSTYTVSDPSITKTVNYNGVQIGNSTFGIGTAVNCSSSTFSNSIFYGNASFTKTGSNSSECNGGNIFYGPVAFTSISGADRWRMSNNNGDIFYNATFTHNGNNNFIIARSSFGNEFFGTTTISSSTTGGFYVGRNNNGSSGSAVFHGPVFANITLTGNINFAESNSTFQHNHIFENTIQINSTASSTGDVIFGSSGFGSVVLTPTAQFVAGSILGASTITLKRITQNGTGLTQTINAGGTSIISSGVTAGDGCTFNANVNFTSPQVQLRFNTFNGSVNSFTQTGSVTNQTFGGNTYASGTQTTFTNQGTGAWRLGNSGAEDYNGDVIFIRQAGAGSLEPAYTNNSTFAGNISTTGTTTAITFGNNGGRATFDGTTAKVLSGSSSFAPIFTRLTMNGTGSLSLNVPLSVSIDLNLTNGIINTSSVNPLTLNAGSGVSGAPANISHVDGPMQKIGNTSFTFPTGDNGFFRSIAISAPINATHSFTAEYFKTPQLFGGPVTYDPSFLRLSSCEYWILDRTNGASNVSVTLSWNSPDCTGPYITDPTTLRVARWDGASWVNHGNGGTTGNATTGTIVSSAAITSFSPITIASTSTSNPLPIELVEFNVMPIQKTVSVYWKTLTELNNDFFTVERSTSGKEFEVLSKVKGVGNSNTENTYSFIDQQPIQGVSYYRLKQTDFDGTFSFSKIVKVNLDQPVQLIVYPNPVPQSHVTSLNYVGSFALFNSLGQMALLIENSNQLDTKGLPPGVYTIKGSTGTYTRLVIE